MKKQKTKELLLERGAEIMHHKGFHNTGIQEIVNVCKVPKGSFYFYFESKEMFGLELINKFSDDINDQFDKFANDPGLSSKERISEFFRFTFDQLNSTDFKGGSMLGNFALELADSMLV